MNDENVNEIFDLPYEEESGFNPITIHALMTKEFSEIEWLIDKLVPSEGIIAVSGTPSAYKTWFVLELALRVSQGQILFGQFNTQKAGILLIDEETGDRWLQQRIKKMQDEYMKIPFFVISKTGFQLDGTSVKDILPFAHKYGIKLVILDSFVRISKAKDENSATEVAKVFRYMQELNKAGISVLFTHHNRKPGLLKSSSLSHDMRGSSDILAAVDIHIAIERKEDHIIVTQTKSRQGEELQPFKLNIISDDDEFRFEYAGEIDEMKSKKVDMQISIKQILEISESPLYKKELYEQLKKAGIDGGYSTFKSAIEDMVKNNELYQNRGERNKLYLSDKPFNEEQETLIT